MSETQTTQAIQRKPSSNKNIKKLRTLSMVCGLTRSWQQWVTENEDKQSSEPSGWDPSYTIGPAEEPKKPDGTETLWSAKKTHSKPNQPTAVSQNHTTDSKMTQKTSPPTPLQQSNDASQGEGETSAAQAIKTKQVVKTVTSGVQEKSAGIGFLTKRITKEALPSVEHIDRMLSKQSSPTRRRKCANMVSSLTQSWNKMEKEGKLVTVGGGRGERYTCSVDTEESGYSVAEERTLETEGGQTDRPGPAREAYDKDSPEGNSEGVKIKRPSVPMYKKEAEDANRINFLSKKYSAVGDLKGRWQSWASEHTVNQKLNPFSEEFDYDYSMSIRLKKGQEGYGHPKEGSKTAERAKRAEQHIHREIDDMCFVIGTMADPDPDGKTRITFGELFDRYVRISDKVVGILMRARRHEKVAFEGEMLWQGRDDAVIITLLV